jgi:hypothetical protein
MEEARRAELAALRIGALRKEAQLVGVDMAQIDEAVDEADEPRVALVELILAATAAKVSEEAEAVHRAELAQLKIGALRKRAKAAGADMEQVEKAIDEADEPKAAVIELIVKAAAGLPEGVPTRAAGTGIVEVADAQAPQEPGTACDEPGGYGLGNRTSSAGLLRMSSRPEP